MGFSAKQVQALRRNLDHRHVRTREAHGRELSYVEGWYAISEANRIFGFDGWNREMVESRCVLARENRGTFLAVYIARVRLTVHADGATIIREGHGTGEGRGTSPGEVHDFALKAAETDGTKRALATFGLCRGHHRQLHQAGDERAWWDDLNINALEIAKGLWQESRLKTVPDAAQAFRQQAPTGPLEATPVSGNEQITERS